MQFYAAHIIRASAFSFFPRFVVRKALLRSIMPLISHNDVFLYAPLRITFFLWSHACPRHTCTSAPFTPRFITLYRNFLRPVSTRAYRTNAVAGKPNVSADKPNLLGDNDRAIERSSKVFIRVAFSATTSLAVPVSLAEPRFPIAKRRARDRWG